MENTDTSSTPDAPNGRSSQASGCETVVAAALAWADGAPETPEMRAALGIEPDNNWDTEDETALRVLADEVRNLEDALWRVLQTVEYAGFDDYNARRVCGNIARQHAKSHNDKLSERLGGKESNE